MHDHHIGNAFGCLFAIFIAFLLFLNLKASQYQRELYTQILTEITEIKNEIVEIKGKLRRNP